MNAGKMPAILNALHFAKCKMSWQKLMILNKPYVQLDDHDIVLLLHVKDPIAPTPNWRKSVENTE